MTPALTFVVIQIAALFPARTILAETPINIPVENTEQKTLPPMDNATVVSGKILTALLNKDPASARDAFFPEAEFLILKDIKDPGSYYKELVATYDRDLNKLSDIVQGHQGLTITSFKRGSCKWKEIGSQYNKIAYWSCYKSKFYAANNREKFEIEVHTLINWGDKWFVTHLGRQAKLMNASPSPTPRNIAKPGLSDHCDIPGQGFAVETDDTAEKCQSRCAASDRCQAMTFVSGWNRCTLKEKFSRQVALTIRGGILDENRKVTILAADIDLSGKDIKHVSPVKTVEACGEACVDNNDCHAFVFMDGYGDCWLKKEEGRQKHKVFSCWQKGT